jgi:aspartate racemase
MYGPTETTIWSTAHNVQGSDKSISIGRPIHNTQIYILDTNLEPTPIGIPGELHIGGLGLARGYRDRAELTAERFIPSPFEPEERLYKTGDLARYLSDGKVELLGRMDHQVKIRSFRIELGEIETTLNQFPGIQQAVVVAREDFHGEKRLVAYVTSEPQSALTAAELTSFLKTKLPEYMVPSFFSFLDEFPRTPNGKIDRRALPAPDLAQQTPEGAFVPARNHLERQIVQIWEKVLNVRPIGVTSNFFELGGYSLLAVRVMRQVEKVFNKKVRVTALFQHPTVEQLARFLNEESSLTPWSSLVPLQPKGSKVPFFWIHGDQSDSVLPQFLGTDQPLYALLHQGHDGKPARFTNVESIATHYLSEIRTVQASGPYLIGGHCFGGLVAFEIAQQLRRQSEEVALLVLVAPSRLEHDKSLNIPLSESISVTREISRHMQKIRRLSAPAAFSYVFDRTKAWIKERFDRAASPFRKFVQDKLCKAYLGLGLTLPASLRSPYMLKIYFKAIDEYRPDGYSGRVVIFGTTPAWRTLITGNAEIREVQGSHTDILTEPYIRAWAQELKTCLEQTQASKTAENQNKLS